MRIFPFFHRGEPRNEIECNVYRSQRIVTNKQGEPFTQQPEVIRSMRVKSWLGLSSPRKVKWFFGLMIWDEK